MKIAVTGASGGLGTRVTRIAIAHGHQVVGIDKVAPASPPAVPEDASPKDDWFRFVEVDAREYDQVIEALRGCDAVIHLAAIPNPGDYVVTTHNLNVVVSWNVLRASAELGIERICQASSINAIGMVWGENPLIDYLPMDEKHPCRPEDPYSLSKMISELQADTIIRKWPNMRIASIRLSWAVPNREYAMGREMDWVRRELWSWIDADESARSFVLGVESNIPEFKGHETFFTVAPNTCQEELTADLVAEHWPHVELRKQFTGIESLYDCSKAERLLGWVHKSETMQAPGASTPAAVTAALPSAEVPAPLETASAQSEAVSADVTASPTPEPAALALAPPQLAVPEAALPAPSTVHDALAEVVESQAPLANAESALPPSELELADSSSSVSTDDTDTFSSQDSVESATDPSDDNLPEEDGAKLVTSVPATSTDLPLAAFSLHSHPIHADVLAPAALPVAPVVSPVAQ